AHLRLRSPRVLGGGRLSRARFIHLCFGGGDAPARRVNLCVRCARRSDGFVKSLPRNLILRIEFLVTLHVCVGARRFGFGGCDLRARLCKIGPCCRDACARLTDATALGGGGGARRRDARARLFDRRGRLLRGRARVGARQLDARVRFSEPRRARIERSFRLFQFCFVIARIKFGDQVARLHLLIV